METLLQMISMGRAVSLIPNCVAKRNPHLHSLMLEIVDDLSLEYR